MASGRHIPSLLTGMAGSLLTLLLACGGGSSKTTAPPTDAPASPAEARRFLTQATFGPSDADLAVLTSLGYHYGASHLEFIKGKAFENLVTGLQVGWVAAIYIVAQACLGFHMWHGVWSLTQTLGWSHPRYNTLRRRFAYVMAILVAGVNISFPIAILTGFIHL